MILTFKYRPVEYIAVSQVYRSAETFDSGALKTLFQGATPPKLLDQQGADNGNDDQKDQKIDDLALGGGEKAPGCFQRQDMDDVGNS